MKVSSVYYYIVVVFRLPNEFGSRACYDHNKGFLGTSPHYWANQAWGGNQSGASLS
jgi:hypothetical protein